MMQKVKINAYFLHVAVNSPFNPRFLCLFSWTIIFFAES